jgi:hypothetical protein
MLYYRPLAFDGDKQAVSEPTPALVKGSILVKMNQTKGKHDEATHCPT